MTDQIAPDQQKAIDDLAQAVAHDLATGRAPALIAQDLVNQGWPPADAHGFVTRMQQAVQQYRNSALASAYAKHMAYGALWAIGGTVVTAITYEAASNGGTYVVAWGAILFGIIDFFRGLFGWLKYRMQG